MWFVCFLGLFYLGTAHAHLRGVEYRFYYVYGDNYQTLLADLNQKGPNGQHAYTKWYVRWRFKYRVRADGCHLNHIIVNRSVTVDFPRWKVPKNVDRKLYNEWARYTRALMKHELIHVDYAFETQKQIEAALHQLKPQPSCEKMGELANKKAYKILNDNVIKEKQFDTDSQYGKKHGAWFYDVADKPDVGKTD